MALRSGIVAVSILVLAPALPERALAQATAPSRVTPQTFAPPVVSGNGGISLPETLSVTAPAGAENLSVSVGTIIVDGGQPQFADVIAAASAKIRNRRVTVAALYAAAGEIEAAYAQAGLVLVRVTIPPQKLVNGGAFKISIIDGFIEAIDDASVPERVRGLVRARAVELIGMRGLTLAQIERQLLLAGDVPGVQLRSALTRGSVAGGTKLVLEGDWRPVSLAVGADNKQGREYRRTAFSARGSLNSVFGFGELVYGSAITGRDAGTLLGGAPLRRIFGLGVVAPIGIGGLTLNPEYTRSDTNPRVSGGALQTRGLYERLAVRAAYPLIKTRTESLNIAGSFEVINERQTLTGFATKLNEDRLRIFTLGLDWSKALAWDANFSSGLTLTQGVDGLGARNAAEALASTIPLSRQGSRPDFSKIDGRFRYNQNLALGLTAAAILRGQATFTGALPSAAQFALDGDESLSAFPLGALSADSGATARAELARPWFVEASPFGVIISPYLFAAYGAGRLERPTALELRHIRATSFGAGLRFNGSEASTGINTQATLEVGRAHSNSIARDQTRVTASFTLQY